LDETSPILFRCMTLYMPDTRRQQLFYLNVP
jgi:hypothetical protein